MRLRARPQWRSVWLPAHGKRARRADQPPAEWRALNSRADAAARECAFSFAALEMPWRTKVEDQRFLTLKLLRFKLAVFRPLSLVLESFRASSWRSPSDATSPPRSFPLPGYMEGEGTANIHMRALVNAAEESEGNFDSMGLDASAPIVSGGGPMDDSVGIAKASQSSESHLDPMGLDVPAPDDDGG